jgi:putative SOS response-associated peptidase YedK
MCFYVEQKATQNDAKERFNIGIDDESRWLESDFINGFDHPNLQIITNEKPDIITTSYTWGLLPNRSKDLEFRKKTLNARIETINERVSYKNITNNRCLIIATAFYEWRWLDPKGKNKEKYKINNQYEDIFCFAGLYNKGVNPENGERMNTFTMVTTEANAIMQYVHNHKKRMPIMLNRIDESAWLDTSFKIEEFALPYQAELVALQTA